MRVSELHTDNKMCRVFIFAIIVLLTNTVYADVYVQHRGHVDINNGYFDTFNENNYTSKFVKEMYYDETEEYLILNSAGKFYQFCEIPKSAIDSWFLKKSSPLSADMKKIRKPAVIQLVTNFITTTTSLFNMGMNSYPPLTSPVAASKS